MIKKITPYRLLIGSIALVYIAFGIPKILGATSVEELMLASYPFFNESIILLIGLTEVALGIAILFRTTRVLACIGIILHLLGTFAGVLFNWNYYISQSTLFTLEGEFVFKNIILISLAVYILSIERKKA